MDSAWAAASVARKYAAFDECGEYEVGGIWLAVGGEWGGQAGDVWRRMTEHVRKTRDTSDAKQHT